MPRVPGHPLSEAEREQRRNAARARWGLAAISTAAGAALGGFAGHRRVARAAPRQMAEALQTADAAVTARAGVRREGIEAAIARRLRSTPDRTAPDVAVIGNAENKRVYDYQMSGLRRQMLRTSDPAKIKAMRTQMARLRQLAGRAPDAIARRASQHAPRHIAAQLETLNTQYEAAQARGDHGAMTQIELLQDEALARLNTPTDVAAHPVRQFRRGGETTANLKARITRERGDVRRTGRALLGQLERRTAQVRATTRGSTIDLMERLLHQRMRAHGARGAAIGAAIGLTAAGVGLLARHLLAVEGKPKASAKSPPSAGSKPLAKATSKDPEESIGAGLAEAYRAWIDRLLGRSAAPVNLGDSLAAAIGPGLTQAFANGATQPPVPAPRGPWRIDVDFDKLNPSTRRHMASYALDRIVEIANEQRENIRDVLMQQSVLQGIGPRDVARSLREHIGLTTHQQNVVRGYRVELETLNPAALERKLRDARYDRTVRRAIETDSPLDPEQIDAMVDAYHRRMLALRAETIARTESIRATSYGALARAQEVLDQHPDLDCTKVWIATDDERTRPTHRDLDGKEVTGMLTPFRTSAGNFLRWPVDEEAPADECINCRCSIGFRFFPKADAAAPLMAEAV